LAVVHKPFTLLFKIYSYDADKAMGYNFQVNFQFRARTFLSVLSATASRISTRIRATGS